MFHIFEVQFVMEDNSVHYAIAISSKPMSDPTWTESSVLVPAEEDKAERETFKLEVEAMLLAGGGTVAITIPMN